MEEDKDCGLIGEKCWIGDWAGSVVGDAIENLARAISEALGQMVVTLSTFWVDLPTSNLTSDGINPSPTVAFLQSGLWYWTAVLAVLAVILGGTRMVWEQRGAPIRDLVRSLLTLTLVSGMGLAVIALLIAASDGFSSWIIDKATNGEGFANAIQAMLITGQGQTAIFMVIIMGLIGIVTSIVQIVLMVVRSGMLVILAGILPTTAAFTNTEMGKQWFQKTIGWTIAFILYKPAAAIVYAVAFRLIDGGELSGTTALLNSITGLALMVVALLALPALLRFVTPMVGAVASGGGGGGGMAMGAAAAAMPSGARSLGSAGRGSGSASPTPASSSSGGGGGSKSTPTGSASTGSSGGGGAAPTPASPGGGKGTGTASSGAAAGGGAAASSGAAAGGGATTGGGASGAMASGGGASGAMASGGGAAAGGGASGAMAGVKAGAAAGPVGAAAGAAVSAAAKGREAVQKVSDEAAGDGPSGSNSK